MPLEIERKFLLPEMPVLSAEEEGKLQFRTEHRIEQTYLAMDSNQELRVRRIIDLDTNEMTFTHTFKKGNGLSREEIEYSISEEIYDQIVQAFDAIPLTKNRITAVWEDTVIEIDYYDQVELIVVEVEFDSLEEANAFVAPHWFGKDISAEKHYSNKKVWKDLQEQFSE
ncbi:CYTH domain-containing protein [Paenibacillus macquariensis]|uniref:CYTH domain-containing protein n=1 Tax=Paenibacillus macquariensis TaxID=948756 RepID=A0ABY1JST5_9BACL|nr:CYTH domain-containing protein [Paenibacillus macquariensis]MEC0092980.1 CYTH domain-containing protein [Paenibacillus macquariensis]OAB36340.1 adenylate cyclase [Paenibacillus macquariensis subsp. macquariensis]SIQ69977.1 CYTH domain-containing protein [Paenibacillus macquariensis]